jgi:hypothetical protein
MMAIFIGDFKYDMMTCVVYVFYIRTTFKYIFKKYIKKCGF